SSSGQRAVTGIDQRHTPIRKTAAPEIFKSICLEINFKIRIVQHEVCEVFFYHITLVAKANYKVPESVRGINHHNMPENRPATNFDHRFRLCIGFLRKASAKSAGQKNDFH